MPRVIIERDHDFRPRRGLIRAFKASPEALVVSQAEADSIVTAGAGRVVERTDKAITFPPRRSSRKKEPVEETAPAGSSDPVIRED